MSGNGKVVIHRWFADGENWATHPWFGGRERQLMAALAPHLQVASDAFTVPGLGGVLVGETVPDPDCPDPKARSRHPTILRAVFVSHPPTDRQRRDLLAGLRRLSLPPGPGANDRLEIRAPAPRQDAVTPETEPRAKSKKPLLILAAVVALLLAGGLVIGSWLKSGANANYGDPPTDPKPKPTTPANGRPPPVVPLPGEDADLTPVGGEVPYLNERTARRFRQRVGTASKYDHPYVAFLTEFATRLPDAAPSCKDAADVRQGLRKLHDIVLPGDDTVEWPAERLRQAIDAVLNYDAWRQAAGRRVYRDRDKPLDESLRRFVDPFRTPEPALRAAAIAMADLLETWGEAGAKEQAARQPLAVVDRFFAILTRPANLPTLLKVDHPHVEFLHRLPPEPVAEGKTFDEADDLAPALRHILYLLDRDFSPHADRSPAAALVRRVGVAMDYTAWIKGRKETFRDTAADQPLEVKRAMKRFDR